AFAGDGNDGEDERVARAFGRFADLKSTFTVGHSTRVADLAQAAARVGGLPNDAVGTLRLAALVHDLGVVSVPTGIWDQRGALSAAAWERVRLHAYWTERILLL